MQQIILCYGSLSIFWFLLVTLVSCSNEEKDLIEAPKKGSSQKDEQDGVLTEKYYQKTYKIINQFLTEEVLSNELETNMKVALSRLESRKASSIVDILLSPALKQFTALNNTLNNCNWDSYIILLRNKRYTLAREHFWETQLAPTSRIENIIYQYSIKHAKDCQNFYEKIYHEKYVKLDKRLVKSVELYLDKIINKRLAQYYLTNEGGSENICSDLFYLFLVRLRPVNEIQLTYRSIKELASSSQFNSDSQKKNSSKEQQFKKHIIEPCEYYTQELGPDVFKPATLDASWFIEPRREEESIDYYFAWSRYRLCERILHFDRYRLLIGVGDLIEIYGL